MDWAFEGCIVVLEEISRVEVYVRDNPKDLLFGAGAEDCRTDVPLEEIEASVHQRADCARLCVV